MKTIILLLVLCVAAAAQALPSQFVAVGAGINSVSVAQATGYAAYGKALNESGTYSYTSASFVSSKPTTVETGIAQRIFTAGPVSVFGLGTAGAAIGGDNLGSAFSGGALVSYQLPKKFNQGSVFAGAKAMKTTLVTADKTTPQLVFGFVWGF